MKHIHRLIQMALFVLTVAMPVIALAQAAAEVSGATEVVTTGSFWKDQMAKVLMNLLPMLMGTLTPWIVSGVQSGVKALAKGIPAPALKALNLILGAAFAAVAGVAGEIPMEVAATEGALFSGVAWKLKEAEPTVKKPADAKSEEQPSA